MKPSTASGRAGLFLAAALLLQSAAPAQQVRLAAPPPGQAAKQQVSFYSISAHLFIIGNLGNVGSMTIESTIRANGARLEETLRMYGSTNAKQVRKNRDYSGEFKVLKLLPLGPDGTVDREAVQEWRGFESSCTGYLKLNEDLQYESIMFLPGHAIVTWQDGTEKRVEGDYGGILSPLEYLMMNDIRAGDVIETPFILNGVPRVFRLEVSELVTLPRWKTRAYPVDIWAYDLLKGKDKAPKEIWRKKGNVRVWICKEGRFRNRLLRIKIKFRWFLWLYFNLES